MRVAPAVPVGTTTVPARRSRALVRASAAILVTMLALGLAVVPPARAATRIEVRGLDALVVDQPGTITVAARLDEADGIAADTPLRLLGTLSDARGEPADDIAVTLDGEALDIDSAGRFVVPPADAPPLTLATHPALGASDGLTLELSVTAPDTAPRALQAQLVRSNELRAGIERLAGVDRIATAVAIARATFPSGAPTVFLARADDFPDALAAGPAAARAGAPILLTFPDELPEATADELARLAPERVVVLGGTAAISEAVLTFVAEGTGADVVRLSGADRFATAAAIATQTFDGPVQEAFVATGRAFADALSGGAGAAHVDAPLLLVERDAIPAATADALRRLRPGRIAVLGGTAAVSQDVEDQLAALAADGVVRHAGSDRFGTSAAIARALFEPDEVDRLTVATGGAFPDALAGTPAAAASGGPLLLTGADALPEAVAEEIVRLGAGVITVLGGRSAVHDDVVTQLGALTRDLAPAPDRLVEVASTPVLPFAATGPTGGEAPGPDAPTPGATPTAPPAVTPTKPPVVTPTNPPVVTPTPSPSASPTAEPQPEALQITAPTADAPLALRPRDRFRVSFTTPEAGQHTVSYRPAGTVTWLDFPNPTATGTAATGQVTVALNAPLEEGALDLQVTVIASGGETTETVVLGAVRVALTFPPPLISALVEGVAGQSQLVAVRPVGGLEEGTRLDIDLGSAERGGADYPLTGQVALLGGTGSAVLEVTPDAVARIVYTAGPGDRVPGDDPTAHPLLTFRIDGIDADAVDESHVGELFRYDILHGVSRIFMIGSGPSIASPRISNLPAGSGHTFQLVSFALREPLAPFERVDIDLTQAELEVADYADAFAYVQSGGGHDAQPPPGAAFLDVEPDASAVLSFVAGPDGVPTVQPEGPTVEIFVGGIAVAETTATVAAPFTRTGTGEVAVATFDTDRRRLTDVTATDLALGTADQSQSVAFTLDGALDGGGVVIELPPASANLDYAGATADVTSGSGFVYLYAFDGFTTLVYESFGDADGDRIEIAVDGITTGSTDASYVVRLSRFDSDVPATAVFDVGAGSVLAGVSASGLVDGSSDLSQELSFVTTEDLDAGATVTVDLSAAEVGLVAYADAGADVFEFGSATAPGSVELVVEPGTDASMVYTAGDEGLVAGTQVDAFLFGVSTEEGAATYPVTFALGDGRTASTTFTVQPPPGFEEVTATDLESGVDGQTQVLTATVAGAVQPGRTLYASLDGAERGAARYGGARAVTTSPDGGTATVQAFTDSYAQLLYTVGEAGLADGATVTIEVRGVNVDAGDETHVVEWYRDDSYTSARALFRIGAGSPFIGLPSVGGLVAGQPEQYQSFSFSLTSALAEGETVVFDLADAQTGTVDYASAFADYVSDEGTVEVLAGETTATVTFVAGPDGLEAGAQAFFELLGVGTGPGVATYDVVVTAGSAVTTTSFDVFQGHGG